ncbi:hypothetical protein J1N35_021963 [Gossypium stocksii]|uniref:Reverse transcriptase zinc-binding domain-containing protein n=1 Tax=Gossypium stocksii TaxID=47602 RepID=A0A9D3VGP9_9ROSI|nr:hypothetical protein J1N35_021963 [Gossypium stocksii]
MTYSWLLLKQVGIGPHRLFWNMIWNLKTLPKIQVFAWRMGLELLPTKANISSIRQTISRDCTRCGESVENLVHALKDCPTARVILTFRGLDGRLLNKDCSCCIDWIENAMRLLDKKAMADFITTLWNSWNNRNNYIFRGKKEAAWIMWERAKTLSQDFRIHNMVNKLMLPFTIVIKKWEKPLSDSVKINFNATIFNDKTGFGVIVRDSDGFVLGGSYGFRCKNNGCSEIRYCSIL